MASQPVCPVCAAPLRGNTSFCGHCGAQLGGLRTPPPAAQQVSPAYPPAPAQPAGAPQAPPGYPAAPASSPAVPQAPAGYPPAPGYGLPAGAAQPPAAAQPAYRQAPQPAYAPAPAAYPPAPVTPLPQPAYPQGGVVPAPAPQANQAVKIAAQRSWQSAKKGMGWLTALVTGGGRAAWTELRNPVPVVRGYVMSQPSAPFVRTPLEPAALLFGALLIFGWLLFLVDKAHYWIIALVLLAAWIGLLALSRLGVRRPYFSRLTWTRIQSLFDRQKGQVQRVSFQVLNHDTNQPVTVVMVGPKRAVPLVPQRHWVDVYGIPDAGRAEVRAWKITAMEQNGAPAGECLADRVIPLTVALLLPLALITLVFLIVFAAGLGKPAATP